MAEKEINEAFCEGYSIPKEPQKDACCQDGQCNEASRVIPDGNQNQSEPSEPIKSKCCEDDTCTESKVAKQDLHSTVVANSCCQEGSCGSKENIDEQQNKKPFEGFSEKISEFRIHGMDCPACALTIEKRISN